MSKNKSDKTKLVRVSRSLEAEFDNLPNRENWAPAGFPEFVRQAIREKLIREQQRARLGIAEREEPDRHQ